MGRAQLCDVQGRRREKSLMTHKVKREYWKKDKGYDAKECCVVDKTIGKEYSMWFPFGHHLIPNVIIPTK